MKKITLSLCLSLVAVLSTTVQAETNESEAIENIQLDEAEKKNDQPLQIATWSPNKTDGRYMALVSGYLTKFNNCLALTSNSEELTTKDNTYLLVLSDNSFSWDAEKEILIFEEKPYKIGDELYLGGGAFTYPNGILNKNTKINWIECGLDKGWLGG